MTDLEVFCLLINHEKKALPGQIFSVQVRPDASVGMLKQRVKEVHPDVLEHVVPTLLGVWRCANLKPPANVKREQLENSLRDIDFTDETKAIRLDVRLKITTLNLDLSEGGEILLIEVPGRHDITPVGKKFDKLLQRSAIRMSGDKFQTSDLRDNKVVLISEDDCRAWFKKYRSVLLMRRKVPTDFEKAVDAVCGARVPDDRALKDTSELHKHEVLYMLASAMDVMFDRTKWTKPDVRLFFFDHLARYAQATMKGRSVKSGFGNNLWPISLPIYFMNKECRYTPKNNFSVAIHDVPCIVAEVRSVRAENDRARMRLSCASLIRLVNGLLQEKHKERNFVVMALYFDDIREIQRDLLYEADDGEVKYRTETFDNTPAGRCLVTEEIIYNTLQDMPAWTTMKTARKRGPEDDALDAGRPKKVRRTEGGPDSDMDGYELLDWTVSKWKPQNFFAVRRVEDGKNFVAKVIGDTDEKQILEYLHERDWLGAHVIPLEDTFFSPTLGDMVVLPVRHCVRHLVMTRRGRQLPGGVFIRFAEQLIEGVAFLHDQLVAHLDIKPDNLVYTDLYRIQIIDFDAAVQLEDEDDEIDEELGTNEYAAPEIGKRDYDDRLIPYSPILADRYSCGVTIGEFLLFDRELGQREDREWVQREDLKDFADRLKHEYRHRRPSLLDWNWEE